MRRQVQKVLSLFLTLSLALSRVPTAFAADSVSVEFFDGNYLYNTHNVKYVPEFDTLSY